MSSLACGNCKKEFKTNSNLDKHMNKKISCKKKENKKNSIKVEDVKNNTKVEEVKNVVEDNKTDDSIKRNLANVFNDCLNILRDEEWVTGKDALCVLTYLIVLKLIEPQFDNGKIDIDNCDYYDFTVIQNSTVECNNCIVNHEIITKCSKCRLLDMVRISKFKEEKEETTIDYMDHVWKIILSKHPITSKIFIADGKFGIRSKKTFHLLINKLEEIDIKETYDILGDVYENVKESILKTASKVLGQYFTPICVKTLMIKTINPILQEDGKIGSCCDPTMGTGGLLITYLNELKKQSIEKNIYIDWEQNRIHIYGKERDPSTFQLAISNMLISTGHIFEQLEMGDSIREPITRKFDNILANPPFGIKVSDYDKMGRNITESYIPIKTSSAVLMFLQAIIHMLNTDGKCAVVLPVGKELTCKTKQFSIIREYLTKTCSLEEIIILPTGVFTYTDIGTCVFHFVKKAESNTALDIKGSGKQKEYKFINEHQTTSVKFYNYDIVTEIKTLIVDVPIDKIYNNSYSLNYSEYLADEKEMDYGDTVTIKTLGEIFGEKTRNYITLQDDVKYNVITLGNGVCKIAKTIQGNELKCKKQQLCNTNQFAISKISAGNSGKAEGLNYGLINQDIFGGILSQIFWLFVVNTSIVNEKYILYIYDTQIYPKYKNISSGLTMKLIDYNAFKAIKIPLPPLAVQNTVVAKLDRIYESINEVNSTIETYRDANKRQIQRVSTIDHKLITLGELCMFLPKSKRPASYGKKEGKYKFYVSSMNSKFCDKNDYKEECLIIGDGGEPNVNYDTNFSTSDHCIVLRNRNNQALNLKYVYYYIFNNLGYMKNLYIGMGLKNITKPRVANIKIRIPPLEIQNQIVAACDRRNEMITELETFIEELKQEAKEILSDALQNAPAEPEVEQDSGDVEHDEVNSDELLE